jgi:DNA-binding beta-propeller fold protein YncE
VTEGEETMRRLPAAFLVFLALAWTAPGHAQGLKQIGTIALPGKPLSDYGAVFVDQNTGKGFLTNRSNKAIDIFDTRTDKLLMRIEGFVGTRESSPVSGPQGVVTVNGGSEAWAGDGDSSIKVIEVATGKITDVLHTGGKKRIGELAYDSQDQIVLAANPNDAPPFVTLYSAKPGHRLLATIPFPSATDGIEREGYFLPTGAFYVPLPKLDHSDVTGGLAEIDPRAGKLVTIHRMENCVPHNLAEVDGALLYVACDYPGGHLALFDPKLGKLVAMLPALGGSGQNAANDRVHQYYDAINRHPDGPRLLVVDTRTRRQLQAIPAAKGAHAVAVNSGNGHVYLPIGKEGSCGGCILVYAPE